MYFIYFQTVELSRHFDLTSSLILLDLCSKYNVKVEDAFKHYLCIKECNKFDDPKFDSIII